jgi:lysophospholipid acyltransferase (LPLAT)-like uncharacterized protein
MARAIGEQDVAAGERGRGSVRRSFAVRHRVDAVPLLWQPLYLLYGYGGGLLCFLLGALLRATSRIELRGRAPSCDGQLLCMWHEHTWPYFVSFRRHRGHVWLAHPYWYNKPGLVALRMIGVERLLLGSTGNDGRRAAQLLLLHLCAGGSTLLTPDAPTGPARQLHKGILHLSAQSGMPIVPLRFECSCSFRLRGWDRKLMPLPFGKITIVFGEPVRVDAADLGAAARALQAQL